MTRLLVSVRNRREAGEAISGGADLIDLKEPSRGALGRCDVAAWNQVCRFVNGRRPVSAALGELLSDGPWEDVLSSPELYSLRFVKIGLAGCRLVDGWESHWREVLKGLPAHVAAVAVSYVDDVTAQSPPPACILEAAIRGRCEAILFDTFAKQGGLFAHVSPADLARLIGVAREHQMLTVLAGSLDLNTLDQALRLEPDFVAVRGGVCRGGRGGSVDGSLVRAIVERLQPGDRPVATGNVGRAAARTRRFA